MKTNKPWGFYEDLLRTDTEVVKILSVNPGGSLSLQYHNYREERWVVLSGIGRLYNGETEYIYSNSTKALKRGDYISIEQGILHSIDVNSRAKEPLVLVEIQLGHCNEKDIIRIRDKNAGSR